MLGKYEKSLFSVIKSLCFCQSGKLCMSSENTAVYTSMIVVNTLHSMHVWFWVIFGHCVFRNCIVVKCFLWGYGSNLSAVLQKRAIWMLKEQEARNMRLPSNLLSCACLLYEILTSSLSLFRGPTLSAGFVLGLTVVFIACFSFWCY